MIRTNIKKVSKKLLEMTSEVSVNLEELLQKPLDLKEINSQILDEWFNRLISFTKKMKLHMRKGIELLAKDILLREGFTPKKVNIKKISELDFTIEQIKKSLSSFENGLTGNNEKKSKMKKEKKKHFEEIVDMTEVEESIENSFEESKLVRRIDKEFRKFKNEIIKINLTFDRKKIIFGTSIGNLVIEDKETRKQLIKLDHLGGRRSWVRTIMRDSYKQYWVCTTISLAVYDKDFRLVKNFKVRREISFYGNFRPFFESQNKKLGYWWTSRRELAMVDLKSRRVICTMPGMTKDPEERPNNYGFLHKGSKLIYATNSNLWNVYHICDIPRRRIAKSGGFKRLPDRLFGIFGLTTYKNMVITTGSSYYIGKETSSNFKESSHIRVNKIDDSLIMQTKSIRVSKLASV